MGLGARELLLLCDIFFLILFFFLEGYRGQVFICIYTYIYRVSIVYTSFDETWLQPHDGNSSGNLHGSKYIAARHIYLLGDQALGIRKEVKDSHSMEAS